MSAPGPGAGRARDGFGGLLRLSVPISLAQLGIVALSLEDSAIVGHASVHELGGVALGRSLGFASIALGLGIAGALEPLASQAIGAGEHDRAWQALKATLVTVTVTWLPCLVAALGATFLLGPFGVDPLVIGPTRAFLLGHAPGLLFFLVFVVAKTFLQANGVTRPSLIASALANAINVVLCAALVLGDGATAFVGLPPMGLPRWGALGAGIASSVAAFVLAAVTLYAAWSRRVERKGARRIVHAATVLRLGMPMGLQLLAEMGVFSLVSLVAGRLGATALAAHQVALGLASFTFMGALGVSGATAVFVGRAIGAGHSPRAPGLRGVALGASFMLLGAIAFSTFPTELARVFSSDPAVVALSRRLLLIAAVFQLFDGVQVVAAGALRGAGDVRFPFLVNVVAHWFVGFPVAIGLAFPGHLGAMGLWWGLTAGLVLVAVVLAGRFIVLTRRRIERV